MKKAVIVLMFCIPFLGAYQTANAQQKYAYVDSEYILENIPAYEEAQKQLDQMSKAWQEEIEAKLAEVDKLYKAYIKEEILLTEDLKQKRQDEIMTKEKQAKELQKSKFGVEGELFKKRKELISPIQDEIYDAIKSLATTSKYVVIFDKANDSNIIFADPRYDISDKVLKKMGITVGN